MTRYLMVIEPTESGFSAYLPDVPGCVATGATRAAVEADMRDAIEFHFDGLREEGYDVPEPRTDAAFLDVAA
ncbi:MAG TPA: type II toxin-antitoxin system HicB family antitoxin [Longimicrobium sp.]|nr:type II toxin-antitoxin system HicB family antitoxin [Longimicrobium sp.]